jgi:L-ascorbate metabolism protein UlaG (beta-lactamase superfamily)
LTEWIRTNVAKVKFVARAVRSGAGRYPAEIAGSLVGARGQTPAQRVRAAAFADQWRANDDACAWLGHCTVLMKVGGQTVLTDPVLSERIGVRVLGRTVGVKRQRPVVLEAHELPPVDVVLLSHAHFDHLDVPTLHALAAGPARGARVITAKNTAGLVPRGFASVQELGWGARARVGGVEVEAHRPEHWGARTTWDRHRGFNSYVLGGAGRRVLFAGDTAMTRAFEGLGPIDLAIMGIGAYDPWVHAHATPEQVWEMATGMGARRVLPVHFGTFKLGDEGEGEPMRRLLDAAGSDRARVLQVEEGERRAL